MDGGVRGDGPQGGLDRVEGVCQEAREGDDDLPTATRSEEGARNRDGGGEVPAREEELEQAPHGRLSGLPTGIWEANNGTGDVGAGAGAGAFVIMAVITRVGRWGAAAVRANRAFRELI
jgi:hypothetical protein